MSFNVYADEGTEVNDEALNDDVPVADLSRTAFYDAKVYNTSDMYGIISDFRAAQERSLARASIILKTQFIVPHERYCRLGRVQIYHYVYPACATSFRPLHVSRDQRANAFRHSLRSR
jgi:hypothetical protein